jgi:CheY-like chemotaxis protein
MASWLVLIADPDPEIRSLLRQTLDLLLQVKSVELGDGTQVLAQIETIQPSLVLLDEYLPPDGGLAVAKRLRFDPNTAPLPIIYMSTNLTENVSAELLACGRIGYLTKPFDLKVLECEVRRYLLAVADSAIPATSRSA